MFGSHAKARSSPLQTVPTDVYTSQVDALFGDAPSLYIGLFSTCMVAFIAAIRSGEPLLFLCALAIGLTGCVRSIVMHAYNRTRPTLRTQEDVRRWEVRYVVGASAHIALLGAFCLIASWRTNDTFILLLSFSTTLAVLIGVSGRNFSSSLLVNSQIICASVQMIFAMAIRGGVYWTIVIFVLLPFFISLKNMATRLRGIFLTAVIRAHELSKLNARFDTALNNMPHGLAMCDAEGRLVVSNQRFAELLRIGSETDLKGTTFDTLLAESEQFGIVRCPNSPDLASAFADRLRGRSNEKLEADTQDDRALAFTFQAMENGGSVVLVEDVTERKRAEARISHLARYDSLTGLPNRIFFRDQTEAALLQGAQLGRRQALLFIDLDQFKQVNDTLGHARGDMLLCGVADRLRTVVQAWDIVGRSGGDEFVLLHGIEDGDEGLSRLAARIIEILSQPYEVEGHNVIIGASIGIAVSPTDGTDISHLLQNADMALYRAKSEGRGIWRFFEPSMNAQAKARRDIELDLRRALADGAFELYYQPLYNLRAERFSVCEALLRWDHPERGMIPPAEFVPIAEEMGLIVEIGNWVLGQACVECANWPADVNVAVNISSVQFRRGSLVGSVRQALAAAKLAPDRLEIEITESVLLQNLQITRVILHQLRELGVRISLDDFGTGYSSLSYLHSLPLNKVKVDRSFLEGLGSSGKAVVLLNGIARLSADLGMMVVVEGVETAEQLSLIMAEGNVDEAQGYLFCRPVPAKEVRALLQPASRTAIRVA